MLPIFYFFDNFTSSSTYKNGISDFQLVYQNWQQGENLSHWRKFAFSLFVKLFGCRKSYVKNYPSGL